MKSTIFFVPSSIVFACILALATPARGVVLLNTYGPNGSYGLSNAGVAAKPDVTQGLAVPFDVLATSTISDITAAITASGNFSIGIQTGVNLPIGTLFSPLLYSVRFSNPVANVVLPGLNWTLSPGHYWLVGRPDVPWNVNDPSTVSQGFWYGSLIGKSYYSGGGAWVHPTSGSAPAALINATLVPGVPEPNSWALMLGGLAAVFTLLRVRTKATNTDA